MSQKITLYQFLKRSGEFPSRQDMMKAVSKGNVTVNGRETKTLQFQFSPKKATVSYEDRELQMQPLRYFALNKAEGYSCQKNDYAPYVLKVLEGSALSPKLQNSLFVIGRLDVPTTGLLLITNDGAFAHKLLDPKSKVQKQYWVLCKQVVTDEQLKMLRAGVEISVNKTTYQTLPALATRVKDHELLLSITEGKYRQVRKMLQAVGNRVMHLRRVAIGSLRLENLNISEHQFVELTGNEKELIFD